jgi:hypothetical protein
VFIFIDFHRINVSDVLIYLRIGGLCLMGFTFSMMAASIDAIINNYSRREDLPLIYRCITQQLHRTSRVIHNIN